MYNRRVLPKVFLSIALAAMMAVSSFSPVLGVNSVIRAQAAENETNDILQTAYVQLNDLGFANYLSIVLADGVEFSQCRFEVDGASITPTKVSDTGSVSKWELFTAANRELTVYYQGKSQKVVFNENGTGYKPYTVANHIQPKWIWSSGTADFFDYHLSSHDAMGNELQFPSKTTFDVLNSTVAQKEEIPYYVKEAILEDAFQGGPALEIKFKLTSDEARNWFKNIGYVARMATPSQSKNLDEVLAFDPNLEVRFSHGSDVGFLRINAGQMALRHTGMNYIRIISGSDAVVIPVEIVEDKAPTLTFTGTITNPRVGEDFRFKLEGANQGFTLQDDFIKVARLKRPVSDGSREQETVDLKFGEIGLIGYLLNIKGSMLTKAGWYELELGLTGYKTVKAKFKILPKRKTPNTEQNTNTNTASNTSNSGTAAGTSSASSTTNSTVNSSTSSSANSGYTGGGSPSGSSYSGGTPTVGSAVSNDTSSTVHTANETAAVATVTKTNEKEAEVTIQENETPLTAVSIKTAKVKVLKTASEKAMKKALSKDVKAVFGDDKNILLKDLLIYLYKADSKKNQMLSAKLSQKALEKKAISLAIKRKLANKKDLSKKALNKRLSKKEIQAILEKFIKSKTNRKMTVNKATKIHALGGATISKKIHIGKNKGNSGSSDLSGGSMNTISIQAECIFDYDMLVNALLLKELGLGNVYSNKIADLFETGLTEHRAIFHEGSRLYDFGKYLTWYRKNDEQGLYSDYNYYTLVATSEDMLKGSAHHLRVVLDNGSLGKHLFGGMSGNPDTFGGELPTVPPMTIRKGEKLIVELGDEVFADNIKIPHGIMVNRDYYRTDSFGVQLSGTQITMEPSQIDRLLSTDGGDSFYIKVKADKYNALRIDVTVIE